MKRGNRFELETVKRIRSDIQESFVYKFPSTKRTVRVPGDILVLVKGKMSIVECKESANKTSFPYRNNVHEKQVEDGMAIEKNGGKYMMFIRNNKEVYILESKGIEKAEEYLRQEERASIPWSVIKKIASDWDKKLFF